MIGVIDYGVGNVQAFLNLYKRIGFDAKRVSEKEDLLNITHIILPGVGHFDHAMQKLNDSGLRSELEDLVLVKKIPIIGEPYLDHCAVGSNRIPLGNLVGTRSCQRIYFFTPTA